MTPSTTLKISVVAPIPTASVIKVSVVNTGARPNRRKTSLDRFASTTIVQPPENSHARQHNTPAHEHHYAKTKRKVPLLSITLPSNESLFAAASSLMANRDSPIPSLPLHTAPPLPSARAWPAAPRVCAPRGSIPAPAAEARPTSSATEYPS